MLKVRLLMLGAAALAVSGVASAQSAQPPANAQADASNSVTPADMIVDASASADDEGGAQGADVAEAAPANAPAKPRRAARVTSCRCGDTGPSGQ